MDYIDIQSRLKRLNKNQKYLSKIFKQPESHVSDAIRGKRYFDLQAKIIIHIEKLENRNG